MHAREFLMIDDRLQDARAAPAVLLGPIDSRPSATRKFPEPRDAPVPFSFVFLEKAFDRRNGVLGRVDVEPRAKFLAEGFILGSKIKIHALSWGLKVVRP